LRPEWDQLFARAPAALPFNSWVWLSTWWDHCCGPGQQLWILVVREQGQVVGIAPFFLHRQGSVPLQLRALDHLGLDHRGRGSLTERCAILAAPGRRAAVLAAIAGHLLRRDRAIWDHLKVEGIHPGDVPASLAAGLRHTYRSATDVIALPASWGTFEAGLPKSMRDNVRYYPRLLARHGHAARARVLTTPDEVSAALSLFLRLHRARAQMLNSAPPHPDYFDTPQKVAFLVKVAPLLAAAGLLRLTILDVDGVPVAAYLLLEAAGTLYPYYSGFDPAWGRYSVMMQAEAASLRDAIERGVRRVDFLGDAPFKRRWGAVPVTIDRITIVRPAWDSWARYRTRLWARTRFRWAYRMLGRPTAGHQA
jgi:CelD/BcsL family acetyltransferase involved in cellulose biosynthesis